MSTFRQAWFLALFFLASVAYPQKPDAPVLTQEFLSQVAQYLYRWHLDETALLALDEMPDVEFRYGWLHPELDEGDRSQFIEVFIPRLNYLVVLKKADYRVPELNLHSRNEGFRIYRVEQMERPPAELAGLESVSLNKQELIERLFATRNQKVFPNEALMERMRAALREEYEDLDGIQVEGPQTIYVAPISEVSNTLWVYWVNAGRLVRFSSDGDLIHQADAGAGTMDVRMYDLENAVVLSHAEAAGSNAFVTREWAARILFNCMVLGQRHVIVPVPK